MNFTNLCINCMKEKKGGQEICPHCGFDVANYRIQQHVLPPFTVLNGRYLIGKELGSGGFGITYIAMDMVLERVVAVKEYFVQSSMYRSNTVSTNVQLTNVSVAQEKVYQINREKFEKEAKTLAHLEHLPGIVRVYDFFNENNTAYIAMEYLPGMTLEKYVKQNGGKLSIDEVLSKIEPIIDSLSLLHENNILHRDISPDNIMVLDDGTLKLFDFGGAKEQSEKNNSVCMLAKSGYTPVEQLQSNGNLGPWTDVYAMAATIYYCVSGKVPDEAMSRIGEEDSLKRPQEYGADISERQEAAILKGLSVNANDRYSSMEEFKKALYETKRGHRHNKWIYLAGITGVAVMAVIVTALTMKSSTSSRKVVESGNNEVISYLENGNYMIINSENEELCLGAAGPDSDIEFYSRNDNEAMQYFSFSKEGDWMRIRPIYTWLDLTVNTETKEVEQKEFEGNSEQLWKVIYVNKDEYSIMNESGGYLIWKDDGLYVSEIEECYWCLHEADVIPEKDTTAEETTTSYIDEQGTEPSDMGMETAAAEQDTVSTEPDTVLTEQGTESPDTAVVAAESDIVSTESSTGEVIENNGMGNAVDIEMQAGMYTIVSAMDSNKYLHVKDNSTGEGATFDIWDNDAANVASQIFYIEKQDDGSYKILSNNSGMVLDVLDGSTESGAILQQREFDATEGQQWYFELTEEGNYYIRNGLGTYLDCAGAVSDNGTQVINAYKNGGLNQQWQIYRNGCLNADGSLASGYYTIASALDSNKVLMPQDGSLMEGARLTIQDAGDLARQKVYVEKQDEGWYKICFAESQTSFDVLDGSFESGAVLQQRNYDATDGQQWYIEPTESGTMFIRSALGTYVDLDGADTTAGTNVSMITYNGNDNQQWLFIRDGSILIQPAVSQETMQLDSIEPGIYQIASAMEENKVLRVANDSAEEGATFVLWDSDESDAERFYVEQVEDGKYKILMLFADKSLDVKDASDASGAVLQQRNYDATIGQQWILEPTGDGYFYIRSALGTYLDCAYASTENGTVVSMFESTQAQNQKWTFRRVG